ncbi:hypothetical protein WJX82_006181 [Trebouxia sp. C0006]
MNCVLWTRGIKITTSQQPSDADAQATPGAVPLQLCLQALGDAQVRKLLDWSLSPQEASRQAFSGTRLVPQKNVELQASLRLQTQVKLASVEAKIRSLDEASTHDACDKAENRRLHLGSRLRRSDQICRGLYRQKRQQVTAIATLGQRAQVTNLKGPGSKYLA